MVVSSLSYAVPEWRHDVFTLIVGLQPEQFHLNCFDCLFVGPDCVFPVSCSGQAFFQNFLWNDWFYHRSHNVSRLFLIFRHFGSLYCWRGIFGNLLLGLEVLTLLLALFVLFSAGSFSPFNWRHWFGQWLGVLQWREVGLGFSDFGFVAYCITVFIWKSSRTSKPFSSIFFSGCDTICSNIPFSRWDWFFENFRCGDVLA